MHGQIRTVVVGSSLKPVSDPVVRTAAEVARAAAAEFVLVHAFPLALGDETRGGDWTAAVAEERASLERRLGEQLDRLGLADEPPAARRIAFGPPHRVLVEEAHESDAALLVLGASEAGGALDRVLGSTADRVVRKATCPVLVTRNGPAPPLRRVLVPVDLSPLSADALGAGLGLLARIAGEPPTTRCLLVLSNLLQKTFSFRYRAPLDEVPPLAERDLDEFVGRIAAEPSPERKVRVGEVTEGILEEIEGWRPDLVLMGTHGRGGFERFLIGSVAAGVIRRSPCSVLVIPPEAALRAALAREREAAAEERRRRDED